MFIISKLQNYLDLGFVHFVMEKYVSININTLIISMAIHFHLVAVSTLKRYN